MRNRHLAILGTAGLIVAGAPLCAQGVSVQIFGTVQSSAGGPLQGASVLLRSTETNFTRSVRTDANGRFLAPLMPVGSYVVTVSKQGFHTAANIRMSVNLGDAAPLNVKLAPETGATVEVVATSATVDSERTTTATLISPDNLVTLPTFNRSFTSLATLAPQVTVDSQRGNLAIGGQRGVNTSINIDGGDNNEPFFGGAVGAAEGKTPFTISIEAIREYQVVTDGASAEFGRMGGGYVNAITKSGSNDLSGSLFFYKRPQSLVAKGPNLSGVAGSNDVADFKQEQFGFTLGGPIIKDKLFYFVAYDGQRRTDPINFLWGGAAPVALDPATYANDAALVKRAGDYDSKADSDVVFLRLDWNPNPDHNLQLRVNHSSFEGNAYTGTTSPWENTLSDEIKTLSVVGQWNWSIAANWLNELRVNYTKDEMPRAARASIPQVNITNVGYYGQNPYPREYETKRLQITEGLTYATPTVQVKAGFDFNRVDVSEIFSSMSGGEYRFSNLADFRAGNWNQYQQRFSLLSGVDAWNAGKFDATEDQIAAYVQTDFRPFDSLKVGVGVRWDRQTHPDFAIVNADNLLANPLPLTSRIPSDSQYSPRLSFTWTPEWDHGKTVLRGSLGRYVSTSPSVFLYQAYTVNGVRMAQVTFKSADAATAGIPRGTTFNADTPYRMPGLPTGAAIPKSDIFTFDPDYRNPRTDRANLSLERAFGALVLGVSGTYAKSTCMERARDINLGATTLGAAGREVFPTIRPNTAYQKIMLYTSDAEGRYHAYTFTAKYQPEGGILQAQLNYTYALDKDNDSNERNFSSYSTQNTMRLGDEWAYSDRDRRHVLTGWVNVQEPFTKINAGLSFKYLSGTPYSLTYGSDLNNDGIYNNDRFLGTERNDHRACSNMMVDVKLSRDFALPFWKKAKFGVSAEVFNLLNRQDTYRQAYVDGKTDALGQIRYKNAWVGSARQVQLGARFTF